MKFLLLLTSVIAVFTVDPGEISGKPGSEPEHPSGDHSAADQTEYYNDSTDESLNTHNEPDVRSFAEEAEIVSIGPHSIDAELKSTEGPVLDSYEIDQNHMMERKGQNDMEMRGKKQDDILKEMSKSLETFKYIMTHAYSELKVELETIKQQQTNITNTGIALKEDQQYIKDHQYNITDTVAEFKKEFLSIKEHQGNITDTFTEFKEELQSIRDHQDNNTAKLDSIKAIRECPSECPSGFYRLLSSNQCFKMYTDSRRTWDSALQKCLSEGLVLAEPKDLVTVGTYFTKKYNLTDDTWLGARGDGKNLRWVRGGDALDSSSSLWHGSNGKSVASSHCLHIYMHPGYIMKPPYKILFSRPCSSYSYYTLCEYVNSG